MAGDETLKRLGGGRWETKDGRFTVEPESGTWVLVNNTQTNELALPLVTAPFPSLPAAIEGGPVPVANSGSRGNHGDESRGTRGVTTKGRVRAEAERRKGAPAEAG